MGGVACGCGREVQKRLSVVVQRRLSCPRSLTRNAAARRDLGKGDRLFIALHELSNQHPHGAARNLFGKSRAKHGMALKIILS
jgi:hypothetical protein